MKGDEHLKELIRKEIEEAGGWFVWTKKFEGKCKLCGRDMWSDLSLYTGYGGVCRGKMGRIQIKGQISLIKEELNE